MTLIEVPEFNRFMTKRDSRLVVPMGKKVRQTATLALEKPERVICTRPAPAIERRVMDRFTSQGADQACPGDIRLLIACSDLPVVDEQFMNCFLAVPLYRVVLPGTDAPQTYYGTVVQLDQGQPSSQDARLLKRKIVKAYDQALVTDSQREGALGCLHQGIRCPQFVGYGRENAQMLKVRAPVVEGIYYARGLGGDSARAFRVYARRVQTQTIDVKGRVLADEAGTAIITLAMALKSSEGYVYPVIAERK